MIAQSHCSTESNQQWLTQNPGPDYLGIRKTKNRVIWYVCLYAAEKQPYVIISFICYNPPKEIDDSNVMEECSEVLLRQSQHLLNTTIP